MSSDVPPMPPQPSKSGGKPLMWVGIGCGTLLIIAIIGVALVIGWGKRQLEEAKQTLAEVEAEIQAEAQAELERHLELMKENPSLLADPETMATSGIDPAVIPGWVPRYPQAGAEAMFYHDEIETAVEGSFYFNTNDGVPAVQKFYLDQMASYPEQEVSESESEGESRWTLEGRDGARELTVIVVTKEGMEETLVIVNYEVAMMESEEP